MTSCCLHGGPVVLLPVRATPCCRESSLLCHFCTDVLENSIFEAKSKAAKLCPQCVLEFAASPRRPFLCIFEASPWGPLPCISDHCLSQPVALLICTGSHGTTFTRKLKLHFFSNFLTLRYKWKFLYPRWHNKRTIWRSSPTVVKCVTTFLLVMSPNFQHTFALGFKKCNKSNIQISPNVSNISTLLCKIFDIFNSWWPMPWVICATLYLFKQHVLFYASSISG